MENSKTDMASALAYLGLMKKAGALALGAEDGVESCLRGRGKLIVAAEDMAPNTRKWLEEAAGHKELDIITLGCDKNSLGGAVGLGGCACAVICDTGFAISLCEKLGLEGPESRLRERQQREKRRKAKKLAGKGKAATTERGK